MDPTKTTVIDIHSEDVNLHLEINNELRNEIKFGKALWLP